MEGRRAHFGKGIPGVMQTSLTDSALRWAPSADTSNGPAVAAAILPTGGDGIG